MTLDPSKALDGLTPSQARGMLRASVYGCLDSYTHAGTRKALQARGLLCRDLFRLTPDGRRVARVIRRRCRAGTFSIEGVVVHGC